MRFLYESKFATLCFQLNRIFKINVQNKMQEKKMIKTKPEHLVVCMCVCVAYKEWISLN